MMSYTAAKSTCVYFMLFTFPHPNAPFSGRTAKDIGRKAYFVLHMQNLSATPLLSATVFVYFVVGVIRMTSAITDFTLACQRGYRISAIKRVNSPHQRKVAGSLSIECQPIQYSDLERVSNSYFITFPNPKGSG